MKHRLLGTVFAAVLAITSPSMSAGQELPGVIRIVVPYPPGGPSDITPRIVAEKMSALTGSTVLIENKPGGGSVLGIRSVINGPKDGSNLLLCPNTVALIPQLYRESPYQLRELVPISLMARNPFVMLVSPSVPVNSAPEFVSFAKERPNQLLFASLGPGSTVDILGRWLGYQQKLSMTAVPYKGTPQAELAVVMNEVQLMVDTLPGALKLHREGRAKILGITTSDRVDALPDIPTLKEQGLDLVTESWLALCAPSGVPKPIIDRLSAEIQKAVASPDVQAKLRAMQSIPASTTPEQLSAMLDTNSKEWGKMIDALDLKMDAP